MFTQVGELPDDARAHRRPARAHLLYGKHHRVDRLALDRRHQLSGALRGEDGPEPARQRLRRPEGEPADVAAH